MFAPNGDGPFPDWLHVNHCSVSLSQSHFFVPHPSASFFCWVLTRIWSLLSSPVSLECFCWSLTFTEVPQGVWMCVCVKPGVCSLGCVCQWCRGWRRWRQGRCICVRVGAARALWPGVFGRNSLHSQGSAWDKSSAELPCTWPRDWDIQAWPKLWHTQTRAQKRTSTRIVISAPINLKWKTTPSSTEVKQQNCTRWPHHALFSLFTKMDSNFVFCFSTTEASWNSPYGWSKDRKNTLLLTHFLFDTFFVGTH